MPAALCVCFRRPQFYAPMPCMIWVACLVEIAIEDWTDFFILLSLQLINASVSLCALLQVSRAFLPQPLAACHSQHTLPTAHAPSFVSSSPSYEAARAGDAVAALKAALKPHATVKRDGHWTNINAAEVVPGALSPPS